jgi:hypothetical protein
MQVSGFDSVPPIEKELKVKLYGEAWFEKANGEWKLISTKVDKSLPEQEWTELQKLTKDLQRL